MYSNPGLVHKKCGAPTGARRNFLQGGGLGDLGTVHCSVASLARSQRLGGQRW